MKRLPDFSLPIRLNFNEIMSRNSNYVGNGVVTNIV